MVAYHPSVVVDVLLVVFRLADDAHTQVAYHVPVEVVAHNPMDTDTDNLHHNNSHNHHS